MVNSAADKVKEVLTGHPEVLLAILFGSRAAGAESMASDLDVAVAGERRLSAAEKMDLIDDFAQEFGCPVDLVDLQAAHGPILQQALCSGLPVVNRKPTLRARLILRMWYNQADVMPNYRMILKERVESFAHG